MPWTRLDDAFYQNRKIHGLGNVAFRLYVNALNWSVANLSDGHVDSHIADLCLAREAPRSRRTAVAELIESGLWTENGSGWVIHDFADYQESRETVEARRQKWIEKKRGKPKGNLRGKPQETPPERPRSPIPIPKEASKDASQKALFGALENLFGPVSPNYRTLRGKVAAGLLSLGATPESVKEYAELWPALWRDSTVTLTETALEKYWGRLGMLAKVKGLKLRDCDVCRNRRQVGVTNEGFTVAWDDEDAVTWKPCRCVKGKS